MISNNTKRIVPFYNPVTNEYGFFRYYATYDGKYHTIAQSMEDLQTNMNAEIDWHNGNIVAQNRLPLAEKAWDELSEEEKIATDRMAFIGEFVNRDDPELREKLRQEGKLIDYVSIDNEKCEVWTCEATEQDIQELKDLMSLGIGQQDLCRIYENHKSDNLLFLMHYNNINSAEQLINLAEDNLQVSELLTAMYERQCDLENLILDASELFTAMYEENLKEDM